MSPIEKVKHYISVLENPTGPGSYIGVLDEPEEKLALLRLLVECERFIDKEQWNLPPPSLMRARALLDKLRSES